jgi:hypothetical protein
MPKVPIWATRWKTRTSCSLRASRRRRRRIFSCLRSSASRMYDTSSSMRSLRGKRDRRDHMNKVVTCRVAVSIKSGHTQCLQAVFHPGTNWAQSCSILVLIWEPKLSALRVPRRVKTPKRASVSKGKFDKNQHEIFVSMKLQSRLHGSGLFSWLSTRYSASLHFPQKTRSFPQWHAILSWRRYPSTVTSFCQQGRSFSLEPFDTLTLMWKNCPLLDAFRNKVFQRKTRLSWFISESTLAPSRLRDVLYDLRGRRELYSKIDIQFPVEHRHNSSKLLKLQFSQFKGSPSQPRNCILLSSAKT